MSDPSPIAHDFAITRRLGRNLQEVRTSPDRLRTLADATPIGIFQTDADNRYVYTNPRWTEITGIPRDGAAGEKWDVILAPEQRSILMAELAEGVVTLDDLCRQFDIRHRSSRERVALVTMKAIPATDRGAPGWIGTIADVTQETWVKSALAKARDEAVSATARQQHFAAAASHELKTPTTSILGFVEEVLESETLSREDRRLLDIAYRNAQRLSQLIDDLLIVGQADVGAVIMNPEPTHLSPLIERVASSFSAQAERFGNSIGTDHEADLPVALVDPMRLEQALGNLIGNALKFTPEGGDIRIGVHNGNDTIELTVADTGTGIDPAEIDNIFDRFYRTEAAWNTAVKGSGLGLAIAKAMVEAQNGTLDVTSSLGEGSTFTITLPVAPERRPGI